MASALLRCDAYHKRCSPEIINKSIFDMDTFPSNSLFMWPGLEHFDPKQVEQFLERHNESTFVLQSTSMPADDHINVAHHVDDILNCVPPDWDILYKGEITMHLGSRFMLVARGPGANDFEPVEDDPE